MFFCASARPSELRQTPVHRQFGAGRVGRVECQEEDGLSDLPPLTVREAAARLRVNPVTIYRLCADGKLRHVRVSHALRITAEDVELFFEAVRNPKTRTPEAFSHK